MQTIRGRARDLLPSVLMTLLSIIQALALEFLWGRIGATPTLFTLSWQTAVHWLQLLAGMLGILQVWVFYTSTVMRFRWLPKVRDLMLPFGIGVLEFAFVDLSCTPYVAWWLTSLAAVYALSMWASQDLFVRARRDPDNAEFFVHVEPATRRDLRGPVATVSTLLLFAGAIALFDAPPWLVLASVVTTVAFLLQRLEMGRRFWNMSMGH
jgi:hypothetical protein